LESVHGILKGFLVGAEILFCGKSMKYKDKCILFDKVGQDLQIAGSGGKATDELKSF
jgi:hypothetical protein